MLGEFIVASMAEFSRRRREKLSIIACDMRYGRTDEQKKQLAAGVIAAVRKATGEPLSDMVFVVREGVGVNFCEAGLHYADYTPGGDAELIAHVKKMSGE